MKKVGKPNLVSIGVTGVQIITSILLVTVGAFGNEFFRNSSKAHQAKTSVLRALDATNFFLGMGIAFGLLAIESVLSRFRFFNTIIQTLIFLVIVGLSAFAINRFDKLKNEKSESNSLSAEGPLYWFIGFGIGGLIATAINALRHLKPEEEEFMVYVAQISALVVALFAATACSIALYLYTESEKKKHKALAGTITILVISIIAGILAIIPFFVGG